MPEAIASAAKRNWKRIWSWRALQCATAHRRDPRPGGERGRDDRRDRLPPAATRAGTVRNDAETEAEADRGRWRLHQSRVGAGGRSLRGGLLWIMAGELEADRTRCARPQRRVPGQRVSLR